MMLCRRLLPLLLLPALACAAANGSDATDDSQGAFSDGKPTKLHPEVGRLELSESVIIDGTSVSCTATLVAPNVVLTSEACDIGFLADKEGDFVIDTELDDSGKPRTSRKFAVDGGFFNGEKNGRFWLVKLKSPVPASVAKPAVLRRSKLQDQEKLVAVGYGSKTWKFGEKNTSTIVFHTKETSQPPTMQVADTGCAAFDDQGALAAMGVSSGSSDPFGVTSDEYAQIADSYTDLVGLIAKASAD